VWTPARPCRAGRSLEPQALVHGPTYPMSHILLDHRVPGGFDDPLHGRTDVTDVVAVEHDGDPRMQRCLGDLDQPGGFGGDLPDSHGERGVTVPAVDHGAAIDRDDVTLGQDDLAGIPCTITSLGDAQITAGNPW